MIAAQFCCPDWYFFFNDVQFSCIKQTPTVILALNAVRATDKNADLAIKYMTDRPS